MHRSLFLLSLLKSSDRSIHVGIKSIHDGINSFILFLLVNNDLLGLFLSKASDQTLLLLLLLESGKEGIGATVCAEGSQKSLLLLLLLGSDESLSTGEAGQGCGSENVLHLLLVAFGRRRYLKSAVGLLAPSRFVSLNFNSH